MNRRNTLRDVAIVVSVLFVVICGITDLIQLSLTQTNLNHVAQTATECIAIPGCKVQSETARDAKALGLNPDDLNVNVQGEVVTLAYVFHGHLPLFPSRHFTTSATAQSQATATYSHE